MSHQSGRVINSETDKRVVYNFDPKKVSAAMRDSGVDENAELYSGSQYNPAKDIADKLEMNGNDRNVRRAIERYIEREGISPKKY